MVIFSSYYISQEPNVVNRANGSFPLCGDQFPVVAMYGRHENLMGEYVNESLQTKEDQRFSAMVSILGNHKVWQN